MFSDVIGQVRAKRALEIAAADGHNILLNGPPGTGKSMLAKALPSILPPLEQEEMPEITHLHSLIGASYDQIITSRPFRAPHHSASHVAIVGGGNHLRPGEVTLAHRGVLFFDEFVEFNRSTIEALRQPLEDREITIARARESITYPANFILVATPNPCPCGNYHTSKPCTCSAHRIYQYRQKLSGPILDRIDLYVDAEEIDHSRLLDKTSHRDDELLRKRVIKARQKQKERFMSATKLNADMTNQDIKKKAGLPADAQSILNTAADRLGISARSYMRVIKIARAIADLSKETAILPEHITEALQYRPPNVLTVD